MTGPTPLTISLPVSRYTQRINLGAEALLSQILNLPTSDVLQKAEVSGRCPRGSDYTS